MCFYLVRTAITSFFMFTSYLLSKIALIFPIENGIVTFNKTNLFRHEGKDYPFLKSL